jgi:hypothetical protein
VPTFGDGIDLYKDQNWKRKFRIGKEGHYIEFKESNDDYDEVEAFLTQNNAQFAIMLMKNEEVSTLA